MRALMQCENMLLQQRLASAAGAAMVLVEPVGLDVVACSAQVCVRLQLRGRQGLHGDLVSCADAWPFADQSVDFVVMRHAIENSAKSRGLLQEAARVLAPEGQMLITGFHPCSLWHVQLLRQQRRSGGSYHACMPWRIEACLRALRVRVQQHVRFGNANPASVDAVARGGPFSACYLLQASKHSATVTPIRLGRSHAAPAVMGASLAATARRQRAG